MKKPSELTAEETEVRRKYAMACPLTFEETARVFYEANKEDKINLDSIIELNATVRFRYADVMMKLEQIDLYAPIQKEEPSTDDDQ